MPQPASPGVVGGRSAPAPAALERPRRRLGRAGTAARLAVGAVLIVLRVVSWLH